MKSPINCCAVLWDGGEVTYASTGFRASNQADVERAAALWAADLRDLIPASARLQVSANGVGIFSREAGRF